jgi:hypothetical protein
MWRVPSSKPHPRIDDVHKPRVSHPIGTISLSGTNPASTPDTKRDRDDFGLACKFVSACRFQIEPPEDQYDVQDSKSHRHNCIYTLLALLLSHRDSAADVTAFTADIQLIADPPVFDILYAENKRILAIDDIQRSEELCKNIQEATESDVGTFMNVIISWENDIHTCNSCRNDSYTHIFFEMTSIPMIPNFWSSHGFLQFAPWAPDQRLEEPVVNQTQGVQLESLWTIRPQYHRRYLHAGVLENCLFVRGWSS